MKARTLIIFLPLILLLSSNSENEVRFFNTSIFRIDSLMIGNRFLGTIEPLTYSNCIVFQEFNFDGSTPDEKSTGYVDNDFYESLNQYYLCGFQKHTIRMKKFDVNIEIRELDEERHMRLTLKNVYN